MVLALASLRSAFQSIRSDPPPLPLGLKLPPFGFGVRLWFGIGFKSHLVLLSLIAQTLGPSPGFLSSASGAFYSFTSALWNILPERRISRQTASFGFRSPTYLASPF